MSPLKYSREDSSKKNEPRAGLYPHSPHAVSDADVRLQAGLDTVWRLYVRPSIQGVFVWRTWADVHEGFRIVCDGGERQGRIGAERRRAPLQRMAVLLDSRRRNFAVTLHGGGQRTGS